MSRVAVLSLHTSPLAQPGRGDAGGMNVYVRELVSSLAQRGVDATVFVRRWNDAPETVEVEPGFRVVHVSAGPIDLTKAELPKVVDRFSEGVAARLDEWPADVLHANYWLSGVAGHRLKHELDMPLVSTFHTLARVKAQTGDPEPQARIDSEAGVIACSDVITASSLTEVDQLVEHYGADPERIDIVAPGVDHAFFSPGARSGARAALGLGPEPVLLFVGRIQPLKGLDVAVRALARLGNDAARLLVVGGASGPDGERELQHVQALIRSLGLSDRVDFIEAQPHHLLATYYRAADACLVPSRSESFGLVALEAAACGTPVVAADIGGLRTLVEDGLTGLLVSGRAASKYAAAVTQVIDDESRAATMARRGVEMSASYTWTSTAGRLQRVYQDLAARLPVYCMN